MTSIWLEKMVQLFCASQKQCIVHVFQFCNIGVRMLRYSIPYFQFVCFVCDSVSLSGVHASSPTSHRPLFMKLGMLNLLSVAF